MRSHTDASGEKWLPGSEITPADEEVWELPLAALPVSRLALSQMASVLHCCCKGRPGHLVTLT